MRFQPYAYQRAAIEWVLDRPAAGLFREYITERDDRIAELEEELDESENR